MNICAPELNQRLSKLYSSAVHDVLRDQGFTNFVLPVSIKPLHSSFKLFGPIFTIEGQLTKEHSDHETLIEWTKLLSSIPANHVGVCQPHNKDIALMGELSAETLKKRNVSGYLVDGGCRDVSKIESLRFPVFCSFNSPKDVVGRWIPKKLGESITIGDCHITTGDYILADSDGAVIIPKTHVVDVINRAETVLSTENAVRSAIMAGMDPAEAYLKHGKF